MKRISLLGACLSAFVGTHAMAADFGPQQNRFIIVNPNESLPPSAALQVKKDLGIGAKRFLVVETLLTAEQVGQMVGAESVQPDFPVGLVEQPLSTAPAADAWHVDRMKYDQLPPEFAGQDVIVGVVDTGVNGVHPQLASRMWVNAGEIAGNGIDDDNNGYVDDVNGYDFAAHDADPSDTYGHGTHCAGIIASEQEPDGVARGIAPDVKIMALRTIGGADSKTFLSDTAEAIKYGVDNGAKVLTNSWRVYKSWESYVPNEKVVDMLKEAIRYAEEHDVLFVVAAGNESIDIDGKMETDPIYPAGFTEFSNLVDVASTDRIDKLSYFTNFGVQRVHIAAPGSDIRSTINKSGFGEMSGTSMATPMTAGLLARGLSMGLSGADAITKLYETSEQLSATQGKVMSSGMIHPLEYLK